MKVFKGLFTPGTKVFGFSTTENLPSLFILSSTLTLVAGVKLDNSTLAVYKPCLAYSILLNKTSDVTTTKYKSPSSAFNIEPSEKLYNLELV